MQAEERRKPTDNRKQHNSDLKGDLCSEREREEANRTKQSHVVERERESAAGQEATNSKQYLKGLNEGS